MKTRMTVRIHDLRGDINDAFPELEEPVKNAEVTDTLGRFSPNGEDLTLEVDTDIQTVVAIRETSEDDDIVQVSLPRRAAEELLAAANYTEQHDDELNSDEEETKLRAQALEDGMDAISSALRLEVTDVIG